MDPNNNNLTSSVSQRRKLTKKPPSSHQQYQHSSSQSIDGRFDAQSLQSNRSSTSLKRAPSAPPARTPTSNASNSSSPRHPPPPPPTNTTTVLSNPSHNNPRSLNPSPVIPAGPEFTGLSFSHLPTVGANPARRDHYRLSDPHNDNNNGTTHRRLNSRASEEFIGAPFDGSAILNRIEATKSPTKSPTNALHRPILAPTAYTSPDTRFADLPLRQSASFSPADRMTSEKSQGSKPSESQLPGSKRFSDETKETRITVLRKKSGFTGFMSGLVGSPKKPQISAPENPVHVTHVGYDSNTGQFTVRPSPSISAQLTCLLLMLKLCHRACPRNGSD